MASSGWQNEQWVGSYDSNIYFNGNVRIDSITHTDNSVRITGVIALCPRGKSGYGCYYVNGIYAQPSGGSNRQIAGNSEWCYVNSDKYSSFDVTLSASASSTSVNMSVRYRAYQTASGSMLYWDGTGTWTLSIPAAYTAPGTPTLTVNTNSSPYNENSGSATITANGWGTSSDVGTYNLYLNGSLNSNSSSASKTFTLNKSTSTSSCTINSLYATVTNNHSLTSGATGTKYIATPTAPTVTATGVSSTSPTCTIKGPCAYAGGTTNSASSNDATIKQWRLRTKQSGASSWANAYTSTTSTFDALDASNFAQGKNYDVQVTATNNYGGTGYTDGTIYCPTGVSGSASVSGPTQIVFTASYNYAGNLGSSTSGSMACYEIKYSTTKSTVDSGGGTSLGKQTSNTFTKTGLSPNTTYYYRVYAWNALGLSNVSSTLSATTDPRYIPEISNLNITPRSGTTGGNISVKIDHTGGTSRDALTVTKLLFEYRKAGASTWTTLDTKTGISQASGSTYTFNDAWTAMPDAGDYEFSVIAYSSENDISERLTKTVKAPASVSFQSGYPKVDPTCPIRILATGTTSETAVKQWKLINVTTSETHTFLTTDTTYQTSTHNHLLFNSTYQLRLEVVNQYGLYAISGAATVSTGPRFDFLYVSGNTRKAITPSFRAAGSWDNKEVKEVYYVVRNALGNLAQNANLKNMRLTFIQDPLYYRPDSVVSFTLSDGKQLAYKLDSTSDMYKFGIWNGDTIETTFFNGTTWDIDHYDFDDTDLTISSITAPTIGANASSAFSTTKCAEVPLWERN